jgi:hypothetical protein
VTDLLVVGLLGVIAVILLGVFVQLERLMTLFRSETGPQWTTLPHPVDGVPHCGHGTQIAAVHSSGNTRCLACAVAHEESAA